jgi:multimeric flavodoxin WrbA
MNIVVLNGSPKGMTSVTMQYVQWLQKKFSRHKFTIFSICHDLKRLEENEEAFREVIKEVEAADGVLWAFPLYYMLVHAHYKRYIELLFERGARPSFEGKYAAILTTSIKFFDHTAHDYIHSISDDLGMTFVGSYSALMYDLLQAPERDRLVLFLDGFLQAIAAQAAFPRQFQPVLAHEFRYEPGGPGARADMPGKKILVITDAEDAAGNLARMTGRLLGAIQGNVTMVNLHEIRIRGGCMGCLQCGLDNECVYRDKDEIWETYDRLKAADVVILAGTIRDRYLSSRWKLFFDRGFYMNHVPIFRDKQVVWLVSGQLAQLANLRQILEGYMACQRANLVAIVTDECTESPRLDRLLDCLAARLAASAAVGYLAPDTFLGVAGRKIFRDELWGNLRMVFQADHRYYRSRGLYDFPRRSLKTRVVQGSMMLLTRIPSFRREFRRHLKDEMVRPFQKVLEDL